MQRAEVATDAVEIVFGGVDVGHCSEERHVPLVFLLAAVRRCCLLFHAGGASETRRRGIDVSLIVKIALGIILAVVVLAALVRVEVRADVQGSEAAPLDEPAAPAMLAAEAELALQDSEWARGNGVETATCHPDGDPVDGEAFDRFRCVLYTADYDELGERAYIEVTGPGQIEVVDVR